LILDFGDLKLRDLVKLWFFKLIMANSKLKNQVWRHFSYVHCVASGSGGIAPGGTSKGGIFWWSYYLLFLSFTAYCNKRLILFYWFIKYICLFFCPYRCLPPPLHIDLSKKNEKNSFLAHLRDLFATEGF